MGWSGLKICLRLRAFRVSFELRFGALEHRGLLSRFDGRSTGFTVGA